MKWKALVITSLTLVAGLAAGLLYAWVLAPVGDYEAAPADLRREAKITYVTMIGDLYAAEQDLDQAVARLDNVGVAADGEVLAGFIEQYLDAGGRTEAVRNLARLAEALGASGGILVVFGPEPTPTARATATATSLAGETPTAAPTVTPLPSFALTEQTAVCAAPGESGRIAVWVRDGAGEEMAGVEVIVSWANGQDRLFTGLRPDLGPGYADFEMRPGNEYEVTLSQYDADTVQELTPELSPGLCPTDTIAVDWQLTFQMGP
jgi:hypothetical protein